MPETIIPPITMPGAEGWPKLSETMAGPKSPDRCQSCGVDGWPESIAPGVPVLDRWIEHDEGDRKTPVVVVLCRPCSDRLIEPHPRLYSELSRNEPYPGVVGLCLDCRHRVGVSCPQALFNGGPGVTLTGPKPTDVHVQRSPRRLSGWVKLYPGPMLGCDRRGTIGPTTKHESEATDG